MRIAVSLMFFWGTLWVTDVLAENKCINSEGEAAVVNGDIPSAKMEAINRAKWTAVEQVVGVEVKAQSIVQSAILIDDSISKQANGVISSFKLLQAKTDRDIMSVKINACVEQSKARNAVAGLALNNAISVFVPVRMPRIIKESEDVGSHRGRQYRRHSIKTDDNHEETNIFSETLIEKLTEQKYTVVDIVPTRSVDAAEIERALKSRNFLPLRSLVYKFLTNILIIGKVDYAVSNRKGENVGYGIAMPFNHVTVRLTYRLISRDSSGKMVILSAGAEKGEGLANNLEDAFANGLHDLSETVAPKILEKVAAHIKNSEKRVVLKFEGLEDLTENLSVKEILQNIAWVTSVEEKGLGKFLVGYQENPIYLANSIKQKVNINPTMFSDSLITFRYSKTNN